MRSVRLRDEEDRELLLQGLRNANMYHLDALSARISQDRGHESLMEVVRGLWRIRRLTLELGAPAPNNSFRMGHLIRFQQEHGLAPVKALRMVRKAGQ